MLITHHTAKLKTCILRPFVMVAMKEAKRKVILKKAKGDLQFATLEGTSIIAKSAEP